MLISEISLEELNRDQITHLLYGKENELDNGTVKGDCIFVFGGTYMERTERAVDLFNHGRAPYVLFTGGDKYGQHRVPEAVVLRDKALALGVPEACTLIEIASNNTLENIICSLLVLERQFGLHKLKRLLLVSSPGHMRRCILMCRTFLPPWVELVWCPDNRALGRRDNWWENPEWERRVMDEAFKVVNGVKEKYFIDADVDI
ncbi:YdcF family protein [Alicyclobacillus fodiniaquatilis]|uniref:YdcF family protein n=1 Tax=Alicyclobacillus fodiniaquatilis TaxID=1661150 RepID=A0ABW4JKK5_9BACL